MNQFKILLLILFIISFNLWSKEEVRVGSFIYVVERESSTIFETRNGTFVNGQVGVIDIKTGKILKYIQVSPKRVVHLEYDKDGKEVWISGWLDNKIYVYDDKTLELKKVIIGDWIKTPTGKFNVYNTSKDIY